MKLISFPDLVFGEFVSRPNRFVAIVRVDGEERRAHIHDPGRLTELLHPGARILLLPKEGAKTDFHLIAVHRKDYGWVFTHSGYHSTVVEKLISYEAIPEFKGVSTHKREVKLGSHRIDFSISYPANNALLEVKGCTLFQRDLALFPDAPTKRGKEHVDILADYGYSMLFFLIMSDRPTFFAPNAERDPNFHRSFLNAVCRGVHIIPTIFSFDGESLRFVGRIPFLSAPYDDDLILLAGIAERAINEYNRSFGPAKGIFSGVSAVDGCFYIHTTCPPEGFEQILGDAGILSTLEGAGRFGDAVVARYRVKVVG